MFPYLVIWTIHILRIWCDPSLIRKCGIWFDRNPLQPNGSNLFAPTNENLHPVVKRKFHGDPNFSNLENIHAIIKRDLQVHLSGILEPDEHFATAEEEIAIITRWFCGSESDYTDERGKKFDEVCDPKDEFAPEYKFCIRDENITAGYWAKSSMVDVNKLLRSEWVDGDELNERKINFFCRASEKKMGDCSPVNEANNHEHEPAPNPDQPDQYVSDVEPRFYEDNMKDFIERKIKGENIRIPHYLRETKANRAVSTTACDWGLQKEDLFKYVLHTYCKKPNSFSNWFFWQFPYLNEFV